MEKTKAKLVHLNGCFGCNKTCKYNDEIADPVMASNYDRTPYGCNSSKGIEGFKLDEGENKPSVHLSDLDLEEEEND